jgi:predicted RNase H-like nuclease (RuvC/YqgF family)
LKTQLDDLTTENSRLKTKNDELANEITQLKSESTKAQELSKPHHAEAEAKEKDMHQRLQISLDALRGEFSTLSGRVLLPKNPFIDPGACFSSSCC